jgi:hypothetical protein
MNNLSGPDRRKIVAAFANAGLLSGSAVNATAVDDRGHYDLTAIDCRSEDIRNGPASS